MIDKINNQKRFREVEQENSKLYTKIKYKKANIDN